jgi:hypothetical protein
MPSIWTYSVFWLLSLSLKSTGLVHVEGKIFAKFFDVVLQELVVVKGLVLLLA